MDHKQTIAQLKEEIAHLHSENLKLKSQKESAEEKLSAALDGTGLCLWQQYIPTGELTIFNREWGDLLGFTEQELAAHIDSWKGNLHPEDREWVIAAFDDHVQGKSDTYQAVHRMIHKDGSVSWVSDRGRIIEYGPKGEPLRIMGTHIDITQEKRYELSLAKLAHNDPLTNLLNRKALEKRFCQNRLAEHAIGGAMFFIDLDGFKAINDKHGHRFGDLLLIHVADSLRSIVGEEANLARMGGDEFVILHSSSDVEQLTDLAQGLLERYHLPIQLDGKVVSIGLSIGISLFKGDDEFITVCEYADKAMYQVKRQGKHNYGFWQEALIYASG
ncbi:sensor domain-containing diguanylate cyclase [Shewanella atlantica]|uniref:Diguanylate cyclase n=1 Tax=Shewanella atlantica TaxID=271099 RepID=A0A431WGD0_9GAMM|nr:sensor domain-containing diguanylate cyclase [Shewanella atlantica]RTR34488.1 diguanylate cyclase [Shewanella atlantica]